MPPRNFVKTLATGIFCACLPAILVWGGEPPAGRELLVDKRGGAPYTSLRAAVAAVKAGDTIKIAPGSGPYREPLFIKVSGEPGRPITVDGSGETVTGFEPLKGFQKSGDAWVLDLKAVLERLPRVQGFVKKDGQWTSNNPRVTLPVIPGVLAYRGERIRQDAQSGQLTKYATYSPETGLLTLLPGVEPESWEISSREPVIQINNVSHHIYRNLRASGSLNDGVNLHGAGEDLVFENIEGFQNIDEGFSAHDDIHCEIRGGSFWANDNGIANAPKCSMKASNVKVHDNSGWGFSFGGETTTDLIDCEAWGNGVTQLQVNARAVFTSRGLKVFEPEWQSKPWLSYQESSSRSSGAAVVNETGQPLEGDPVETLPAEQAPKLPAVTANP